MLTLEQFEALANAASVEGDEAAYVVPYGSLEAAWGGTYDHRLIGLAFNEYRPDDELILEHLIYSPAASWAVVTSDSDFAVAGGTERFIETLRSNLSGDEDEMARAFVRDWSDLREKGGANAKWVYPFVAHIFGDTRARELGAYA
jgi:hypothetical protein